MDLDIVHQILQDNMNQYDRSLSSIRHCLVRYENHCSTLIDCISEASSLSDAEEAFEQLIDIQSKLAALVFGRNIDVGERLDTLTREFDRLYDHHIRKYWFEKFQAGEKWPTKDVDYQ